MSQDLSHFDETSGFVACHTPWGRWWQTVHEVHVEVNLPEEVGAKDVEVNVKTNQIGCFICGEALFTGDLSGPVRGSDTVWTVEDDWLLSIVLSKADHATTDEMWKSLLRDDPFPPDTATLHEMRKKLDLERFQIENPGVDFSNVKLAKKYDRVPGWSIVEVKKRMNNDNA